MVLQMSCGTVYKHTNRLPDIYKCLFRRVCLVFSSLTAVVCTQDAQSYADDNSLLFMETSAKTSMNVNEIFMAIGKFPLTSFNETHTTFVIFTTYFSCPSHHLSKETTQE